MILLGCFSLISFGSFAYAMQMMGGRRFQFKVQFSNMITFILTQICQETKRERFRGFSAATEIHHWSHIEIMSTPCQFTFMFKDWMTYTQIFLEFGQERNICWVDSSACKHITHRDGPEKALFIRLDPVGTLFSNMFHISSLVLGGASSFQSEVHRLLWLSGLLSSIIFLYPNFGEYWPFFARAHMSSSSSALNLIWVSIKACIYRFQSSCHSIGKFQCRSFNQACVEVVEFCWSPICERNFIPLLFK